MIGIINSHSFSNIYVYFKTKLLLLFYILERRTMRNNYNIYSL